MTAVIVNSWGRVIAEQPVRNAMDTLSLVAIYSSWARAYVLTKTGTPIEMFVR